MDGSSAYTAAAMSWGSTDSLASRRLMFPVENPRRCWRAASRSASNTGRLEWFWAFYRHRCRIGQNKQGLNPAPLFLCSAALEGHVMGLCFLVQTEDRLWIFILWWFMWHVKSLEVKGGMKGWLCEMLKYSINILIMKYNYNLRYLKEVNC